ncbi:MAG: CDK5RAP3 family protein [Methylococcaceae bacterium]|nr:CDK5RAP3 family protein [Methylococcaceae bacterium]MCI0666778.1 CDK5RAP3 family protein [Methylococcaceae bacterium]MCI0733365.1 CDK5RAP3 family protein [Methylococcaceae bacterium]
MIRGIAGFTLFAWFSVTAFGGALVDFRDRSGQDSQFLSDGKMGRLNLAGGKTYIILDFAKQSMKGVLPEHKEVLDMGGGIPSSGLGGPAPEKSAMKVEPEGDGPEVAGYETQRYKLSVNGEFCGSVFASTEAMEDTGLDQMFRALQRVAERTVKSMPGVQSAMTPCQRGKTNTFDHIASIGAPLRSLDDKGEVDVEVTRIQTDFSLPPDTFAIPNDYKVVSVADKMKQVQAQLRSQLQKLQNNMPETERKLAELQKSGKLSRESVQKLKHLLKQYQSQQ